MLMTKTILKADFGDKIDRLLPPNHVVSYNDTKKKKKKGRSEDLCVFAQFFTASFFFFAGRHLNHARRCSKSNI